MSRLKGKVAVVTGGNSGIGLATAKRLQEEGARVVISGRSKKTLDEAVKTIGNGVLAIQADVSQLDELDKLYGEVSKKLGKIDVLFVNAGVAKFAPLVDTSEGAYDEQFGTNVKGAYFTIQKALPLLNDGASIILNTSVAGSKGRDQRLFSNQSSITFPRSHSCCRTSRTRHSRQCGSTGTDRHPDF